MKLNIDFIINFIFIHLICISYEQRKKLKMSYFKRKFPSSYVRLSYKIIVTFFFHNKNLITVPKMF